MAAAKTVIDIHTHAFPDELISKVIPQLEQRSGLKVRWDGTLSSILRSMEEAGIESSVICSIATKPDQFDAILRWSKQIASPRLIPFASVHPDDPQAEEHIRMVLESGLKGIKMHPYYQGCALDDRHVFPIYEAIQRSGLILLAHTGFDIGFGQLRIADPQRIIRVLEAFPDLKLVTSHLGGWQDWDDVEEYLLGRPVYMEISFSLQYLDAARARRMILSHPKEYLLFGSDSPWGDQAETIALLLKLDLGEEYTRAILCENAALLLGR